MTMKQTLLAMVMLMASIIGYAQFKVVPGGTIADDEKTFVVYNIDGSQQDLYNKAKTAITAIFVSAKDVISYNEPDIIVVNGVTEPDQFSVKRGPLSYKFGMNYRIQIQFKEGRIRVDAPTLSLNPCQGVSNPNNAGMSIECGGSGNAGGTYHLFDKNGKCRNDKTLTQIQDYLNGLVDTLVTRIQGGTADEDW